MLGKGLESLIPPQRDDNNPVDGESPDPTEVPAASPETREWDTASEAPQERASESHPDAPESGHQKESDEEVYGTVFQIEIEKIRPNPHQPRKQFDEESLRELALSIREFGVLQPLIVSKVEQESEWGWSVHYELVAGERRLMASRIAGLTTVPVIIRTEPADREKLELAVVENIQRADLNPVELARAIARLQDEFGLTQREIATRLGKSRESIANTVRLLALPTEIQEAIADGRLTESHARLLLSIDDVAAREQVFRDIVGRNLNVRETEEAVKRTNNADRDNSGSFVDPEITSLTRELEEFLGTNVRLQSRGKSGKITINFYSPEELEAIIDRMIRKHRGGEAT